MAKVKLTKKQRRKRKLIILIIEIVVFLILLGALFVWTKLNLLNHEDIDVDDLGISEELNSELTQGYTNIAIFGVDNRSTGSLTSGNSDTIVIASINNDTGEIRLVSVFRDTYLAITDDEDDLDDYTFRKANAAYARGGPEEAIRMLNSNLDLDITDYVTVDFYAVAELVDLVGGIELDISDTEASIMNGQYTIDGHACENYIATVAEATGKEANYVSAGTQTVDGVQAVAYCRVRYTSGGDFTRSQRQRIVLAALFQKLKESNIATINEVVDEMLPNVSTSLTNKEILALATKAMGYELADTSGFPFSVATETLGSVGSVDIPCTLESNVSELYEFLFDEEDYTPSNTVRQYSEEIISNSGYDEDDAVDYGVEDDNLGTESSTDEDTTEDEAE